MMTADTPATAPVRKSVTVNAGIDRAFEVFTAGIDTWWPRSHHIGTGTLERTVLEPRLHGRCYGRTADGAETQWGSVLAWEPPHRFVLAWQITPDWKCETDPAKASEVEVRFTAEGATRTRVDLEHRHFHRHGEGGGAIRQAVDSPGGWSGLLQMFVTQLPTATIAPLALIFSVNDGLVARALDGLSDEELTRRVTDHNNPIIWIAAHAITTRGMVLKLLGDDYESGWGDRYSRGSALDVPSLPSRANVLEVHGEIGRRMQQRLAALTDDQLAAPAGNLKLPNVKTLADAIGFFALHDSYHVGQMAFVRKALGHSPLVG